MGQYSTVKAIPIRPIITITRIIEDDRDAQAPDERDEGFWPSHDKDAAGYCPPHLYDGSYQHAVERMRGYEQGDWCYVGIQAKAEIIIPIGPGDVCIYTLKSAGLWGVESDAGEAYLSEIFQEQASELKQHIALIASAPVTIE